MNYSNETYKILKSMQDGKSVNKDCFDSDVHYSLLEDKYIRYIGSVGTKDVVLTDKGKAYYEQRWKDNFRFWFSTCVSSVFSVIAIAVSIVVAIIK